jgi:hypothetical protein
MNPLDQLHSVEWQGDQWIKNWKECGRKRSWLHLRHYTSIRLAFRTITRKHLWDQTVSRGRLESGSKEHGTRVLPTLLYLFLNLLIFWRLFSDTDRLCGLVVRVPDYRSRGPGFDSGCYQIFWEVVGLERGPLSLVRLIEELLERTVAAPF